MPDIKSAPTNHGNSKMFALVFPIIAGATPPRYISRRIRVRSACMDSCPLSECRPLRPHGKAPAATGQGRFGGAAAHMFGRRGSPGASSVVRAAMRCASPVCRTGYSMSSVHSPHPRLDLAALAPHICARPREAPAGGDLAPCVWGPIQAIFLEHCTQCKVVTKLPP